LITVEPVPARDCGDSYVVAFGVGDVVITRRLLETHIPAALRAALVIRTLPNDDSKLTRRYDDRMPPYFTTEAMELIASLGFRHLLVDLPSIDRMSDDGMLSNHRIFWNVAQRSFETNPQTRRNSTVTELIFAPNEIPDGEYILNLQIAPFESDASPSRPILFKMKNS
jgi:kynurenine formamidase